MRSSKDPGMGGSKDPGVGGCKDPGVKPWVVETLVLRLHAKPQMPLLLNCN